MATATKRPGALGMLLMEDAAAWRAYLDATQGQPEHRYREVEPWAFRRLCQRLRAIDARRSVLLESVREDGAA